ncbi:hypothetical protein POTOM_038603 [Populus tomentosa]|uniref:Uncharacterized protein n=1 Tax=Populus tomentosa TaxID=118781 RepID=A0A8X7YXM6_POPTO|nr:hypothetical protein POTOM_038603 [Populus tomentosa]
MSTFINPVETGRGISGGRNLRSLRYERRIGELLGVDCGGLVGEEKRLVIELMPKVLPLLKDGIKESSIYKSVDGDEISAAPARAY